MTQCFQQGLKLGKALGQLSNLVDHFVQTPDSNVGYELQLRGTYRDSREYQARFEQPIHDVYDKQAREILSAVEDFAKSASTEICFGFSGHKMERFQKLVGELSNKFDLNNVRDTKIFLERVFEGGEL